jgi:hypothetical protein
MTILEKCKLFEQWGYTYNPKTGEIFGIKGNPAIRKGKDGYIILRYKKQKPYFNLMGHHFAWYMVYGEKEMDFEMLDHINHITNDNRIDNLRKSDNIRNQYNRQNVTGVSWNKRDKLWYARIKVERKPIHLGCFKNEMDARKAYLQAKEKYHIFFD